jgi:hypothetical protein
MSYTRFSSRALLLLVTFAMAILAASTTAPQPEPGKLGTVAFPTFCSNQQAQAHFSCPPWLRCIPSGIR